MARYHGAALAALAVVGAQDVSRECKMKCNEALGNLPQALDCRDWRMMLPRPKVGKACTQAYDDAAFAVCTARCEGREPPRKEALTGNFCREYTAKTPKPTMGKSCRSGYAKGFDKGLLIDVGRSAPEPAKPEPKRAPEPEPEPEPEKREAPPSPEPASTEPKLLVSLPVTVDDQEIYLQVFEGEDHMKKIEAFCMQYMADSSSSCVTQLTPHVEKKL